MPVVAVNLPQRLFSQINRLISRGEYETPAQFMEMAAFNQLALEAGASPDSLARSIQPGKLAAPPGTERVAATRRKAPAAIPEARYGAFLVNPGQVVQSKDFDPSMKRFALDRLDGELPAAHPAR